VRGQVFGIAVDEEDGGDGGYPPAAQKVSALLREIESVRDQIMEIFNYYKENSPSEMASNLHGTAHLFHTKITEAMETLRAGNLLAGVGKVFSAAFVATDIVGGDIIKLIADASEGGTKDIPLLDYIDLSMQALRLAHSAVRELYEITKEAVNDERTYATVASLQRLQQALQRRLARISGKGVDLFFSREAILQRLEEVNPPEEVRQYIEREIEKLGGGYLGYWAESEVTLKHINFLLSLPWSKRAEARMDISAVAKTMDERLFGLRKAKERVIEYLATLHHLDAPALRGVTLCFVGPPGTGKTDLARQIAHAMGRPFARIALGGVNDEANIKGHRRTYVGAMPGDIMKALAKCGVKNPVILLDEVDKMRVGVRGDPVAALMDALDPEFNHQFLDFFVDFPFDLSEVLFICTANNAENIPAPLRDRMEIIEFRPYTYAEKKIIAKNYLIPRLREELKCPEDMLRITDGAIDVILSRYTVESGVRELYRTLRRIFMKAFVRKDKKVVSAKEIPYLLWDEVPQVWKMEKKERLEVGMAPTLGVLSESGEGCVTYLMLEMIVLSENPQEEEDILCWTTAADSTAQQSVLAGIRVARRLAAELLQKTVGKVKWIVHSTRPFLTTSGTSWGVSATLAALSCFMQKPLPPDYAYTGEVDIYGNIYAVGGLSTKIATAELVGFKTLYVPAENKHALLALDFTPRIKIVQVGHIKEILERLKL